MAQSDPYFLGYGQSEQERLRRQAQAHADETRALFEEIGWTGFAIPRLRLSHGVLTTGVTVGALWGAWHVPVTVWASGDSAGAFSPTLFVPPFLFYVAVLPAYRMLMVWVYDRTGSLLVATLMHASLIVFSLFVLVPMEAGLVTYYLALATALWAVVAVVAVMVKVPL